MGFSKTLSICVLLISLSWLCVCQASEVQPQGEKRAQISLPNHEVTSFFNLATTALLFAVVWVILGPILTGEVVLIQAKQPELTNTNARADVYDYGQSMQYDTVTDSANNLYKWWTEQYYPENNDNPDGYQTNYDETGHDNRQTYDPEIPENYDEYSGSTYNDPYTSPYGYDWTNYYANTENTDEYNANQYYGEGYNGEAVSPSYSEGRDFQFSLGGTFGTGVETVNNFWQKISGKASRALDSIDIVDTTFGVMNIDSEPCRKRTICEMERVATQYPIVSFIVKTVSPYVRGLSKYDDAVQRGANGEDCALYYDDCPYTLDKLPKFFQQH